MGRLFILAARYWPGVALAAAFVLLFIRPTAQVAGGVA